MKKIFLVMCTLFLVIFSSQLVLGADAFVTYRNVTGTGTPFLKYWNSSGSGSFSSEIILPDSASPLRQVFIRLSPISSKAVVISFSDDGNVDGYVCMYNCTNTNSWTQSSNFISTGVVAQRRFDFAFESKTGDLVLVYAIVSTNTAQDLAYVVLPHNSVDFSSLPINYIDDTTSGADITYSWIAMDSNPLNDSEEITLVGFDSTSTDSLAWIWNGSAFTNQIELTDSSSATGGYESIATRYAFDGSRSLVVSANGTSGHFVSAYWSGASWSSLSQTDVDPGDANDIRWVSLKPNPSNTHMQAVFVDSGSDLGTGFWNGSSTTWTVTPNIDAAIDIATTRPADFSWISNGSFGKLMWDTDTVGTNISERTCSPLCTGAITTISTYAGTGRWIASYRNPTISDLVEFIALRIDDALDLGAFYFNGTGYNNYGNEILTPSTGTATYEVMTMGFITDNIVPIVEFISPTPNSSSIVNDTNSITININASEPLSVAILEFNGTNYTMDASVSDYNFIWDYTLLELENGFYSYKIYLTDWYGNFNITLTRNFTINYTYVPPSGGNFSASPIEAIIAYRNAQVNSNIPYIKYWNSSDSGVFSSEITLSNSGSPIRHMMLRMSPVSSKSVLVTFSDDGNMDAYVCPYACSNNNSWVHSSNFATTGVSTQRRFDMEFETSTGDLLFVFSPTSGSGVQDVAYYLLPANSTSFSGLTLNYVDDTTIGTNIAYSWIGVDRNPQNDSEEITIIGFDSTSSDIVSWIWNGSAFTNQFELTTASTATAGFEALATRYNSNGSKSVIVGGDGTVGNFATAYWNGTGWSAITSVDIDAGDGNDVVWVTLKPNPSNNNVQAVIVDSGQDLHTNFWNDSSNTWTITQNIDAAIDISTTRPADFSWVGDGSFGKLVWDTDAALGTLSQRTCSPLCTGSTSTISTYVNTGSWIALFRHPFASSTIEFIGLRLNALFNLGAFYFNGANFVNYGDSTLTSNTSISTYEFFTLGYVIDLVPPSVFFVSPTPNISSIISNNSILFSIDSNEPLRYATLEISGTLFSEGILNATNYSMSRNSGTYYQNWNLTLDSLEEGFYEYSVYLIDWYSNQNVTLKRNFSINFPPNITLVSPINNTANTTSRNITFTYNVNDTADNVSSCSLIIDNVFVLNTTSSPVSEGVNLTFNYTLTNGQHNWSVWCNDTNNLNSTSEILNITIRITPRIDLISITDNIVPDGEITLNPGSSRFVNCSVVVSDPEGPAKIINVTSTFYYYLNLSTQSDDNSVHYTNSSCSLASNTSVNKTFSCGFNVLYYANNGTWNCSAIVTNNYSVSHSNFSNTIIAPLYAINLTDGLNFGNVASGIPSSNITANITNFGNMPLNITLRGYALFIGDNVGMNCSDNTNITISRIRYSTIASQDYSSKTSLTGAIQQLSLQLRKQTTLTPITNMTYWQIDPDPGNLGRMCGGYVLFSAESQ